jgi:hypothetical protein
VILPIVLTGRLGLPGGGVPNFTLDPSTGEVIGGQYWPQGAGAADPATGEPVTADSSFTNDAQLWNTAGKGGADPNVLNTAPLWNTRGTQWNRRGTFLSESAFDDWRRKGKPTACSKGVGDYTLLNGTPCDPTVYGTALCQDSTQRIIQAIAAGANVAAGGGIVPPYGSPGYPGYTPIPGGGSVTVSGGASAGAWLFGGLIVVGLVYAVSRR